MSVHYFIWICPYCGDQYQGPGGHAVGGDDVAANCSHRHPGERGVTQPRLVRIAVVPAEPLGLLPIPHDQPFRSSKSRAVADAMDRYEDAPAASTDHHEGEGGHA